MIYCVGLTRTPEWPVTENAIQDTHQGGGVDAVLCQLDPSGSELIYSTFLGTSGPDFARDIALDDEGVLYLCGVTSFADGFPVTPDALFPEPGWINGFLLVFDPAAQSLVYSSYLPGNSITQTNDLVVVSPGVVWTTGYSRASDIPVTPNALQPEQASTADLAGDGVMALWDLNANQLLYCSYLGGSDDEYISDISALNDSLIAVVGGTRSLDFPTTQGVFQPEHSDSVSPAWTNAFVSVINPYQEIIASTYFSGDQYFAKGSGVQVDSLGVSFFGRTDSPTLPTTPGAFDTVLNDGVTPYDDVFLARFSPDLANLYYSTFIGGQGNENYARGHFDESGHAWICGRTGSPDMPTTEGAYSRTYGGWADGYIINFEIPASPPFPPDRLTIQIINNDIILDWSATGYATYRIFSLPWPNFPYPYLEAETNQTTLTLPDAIQNNQRVYYVVGVE